MKLYYNVNPDGFTNSYTIISENSSEKEAIMIDPCIINTGMINQIEKENAVLKYVLLTHSHPSHIKGLSTLCKIYNLKVFAADPNLNYSIDQNSEMINGDGKITLKNFEIEYFSIPGHSPDSMVFKIENIIFTGDTLINGMLGSTSCKYSEELLVKKIAAKLSHLNPNTIVMPGHGCPSTLGCELKYNIDLN